MIDKVLIIYSTCKPIKGAKRSIICDLVRHTYEFIPNDMYDFIINHNGQTINTIKSQYTMYLAIISEYIEFLLTKEIAFLCDIDEVDFFPVLNSEWDFPSIITNGIIDIDSKTKHDFRNIFIQYENLGCKNLLIRSYVYKPISFWEEILSYIQKSSFKSIEIVSLYSDDIRQDDIFNLITNNGRVRSLTLSSADRDETCYVLGCTIVYSIGDISSHEHCGNISPKYFAVNNALYFESLEYNNCLNRKICIDATSAIKNCPSMEHDFGNINNINLVEVIENDIFKSYWHIKKDEIEICKVCEFRYICTDCRAFVENVHMSKPLKCGYDPYKVVWKNA